MEEPDLAPYAREARLAEDVAQVFEGTGGALLLTAVKPPEGSGTTTPSGTKDRAAGETAG